MFRKLLYILPLVFSTNAYASDKCSQNLNEIAQETLKSQEYTSVLDFKTHDFFTINGETIVLRADGVVVKSATITHIVSIENAIGNKASIIGHFIVHENLLIAQEFCVVDSSVISTL